MIVYFTASIAGKKYYLENYLEIIKVLKDKKIEVIADHIIHTSKEDIAMKKKEGLIKFKKQLDGWINSCDFMIAGVSFPSISVGYEISLALHKHKPILVLYTDELPPPTLLAHSTDENLIVEKYNSSNLKGIIENFINYVQGAKDIRFTFFITPEIASYLERISKKSKTPKSVYLRKLIEADMVKTS
jgi:2'-deoxynucleoside 5'-phosphate N-hydrolase